MDLNWIKNAYDKWIQGEDLNFQEVLPSEQFVGTDM
jgi:hypothetical protein